MACAPSEDSDQSGHLPSLIRVFAVRMKKAWVLSYPLSAQRKLIRLGGCPGWSESSLGAQSFCCFCHEATLILSVFYLGWEWEIKESNGRRRNDHASGRNDKGRYVGILVGSDKQVKTLFSLLGLHRRHIEIIHLFSKAWILAFFGIVWWKKQEYRVGTTDIGRESTTFPHADTEKRFQAAEVASKGFTHVLSRLFVGSDTRMIWENLHQHLLLFAA